MASEVINKYIEERYERWLDYSKYHCSLAGMDDEAADVLNEVLCMLLQKNPAKLSRLYLSIKGNYRELDFYILQMIKLNITSETSPYQHKYRSIPKDDSTDWQRLNISDETPEDSDRSEEILEQVQLVRKILDGLGLSEKAKRIFSFKFFEDESFSDWEGPEDKKELYEIYNNIVLMIKEQMEGRLLF